MRGYLLIVVFIIFQTIDSEGQVNLRFDYFQTSLRTLGQGAEFNVASYYIANSGNLSSDTCSIGYYLSSDPILSGNDAFLGKVSLPSIISKGSYNAFADVRVKIPVNTVTGDYYLIHKVDYQNKISESDETDNEKREQIKVQVPQYDLSIIFYNISQPFNRLPVREKIEMALYSLNNSNMHMNATMTKFFLSADTVIDANDLTLATVPIGPMLVKSNPRIPFVFNIPGSVSLGNYYIIAKCDYNNQYQESNEINNFYKVKVILKDPFLDFQSHKYNSSAFPYNISSGVFIKPGQSFSSLENNGNYTAKNVEYQYIFTDDTLNAPRKYMKESYILDSVEYGGESHYANELKDSLLVPEELPKGKVFLGIWMDPLNKITESNENNNVTWYPLNIVSKDTVFIPGGELESGSWCRYRPTFVQSCKKVIKLNNLGFGTCFYTNNFLIIRSENGLPVTLEFTNFAMGDDTISIFDNEVYVGKYQGNSLPGKIISTKGNIRIATRAFSYPTGNETFTAKISCNGTVTELNETASEVDNNYWFLYPNPNEGVFNFTDNTPQGKIEIRNSFGQVISVFENRPIKVDISNLAKGIYTLQLHSLRNTQHRSFVIR